jgi:hypothetical protein
VAAPTSAAATPTASPADAGAETDVDAPELTADIEQVAADQITVRIAEEFAGHGLATLITAILTAEGYHCTQSPPGPDGGIDIAVGRGPLGLDSPRVLAQVKSGGQIGSPVVAQLHGVMATHGAEQGLLVAWGGLSRQAREALRNQQMRGASVGVERRRRRGAPHLRPATGEHPDAAAAEARVDAQRRRALTQLASSPAVGRPGPRPWSHDLLAFPTPYDPAESSSAGMRSETAVRRRRTGAAASDSANR